MEINAIVNLGPNDTFAHTPAEAATLVLNALGANPITDFCTVNIAQTVTGAAGQDPAQADPAE